MVRLYARAASRGTAAQVPVFVVGSLLVWLAVGAPTHLVWRALEEPLAMGSASAGRFAGAVLVVAATYQLTPLEQNADGMESSVRIPSSATRRPRLEAPCACYCMCMLTERLQILLDGERRRRLEHEAAARGVSVAALIRDAIDLVYPSTADERQRAAALVLGADAMDVPAPDGMRTELDELRGRRR